MYNILLYIYEFGIFVATFFSAKVKKMWRGERETFKILKEKVDPEAQYAWFHAASLGEFEQGRPIIEEYRRVFPKRKILLTFFSPSGYEVRKNYDGADIVCYLPIDTPTNALRFLRAVRPVEAFFIKYEFWYNYLHILRHRGIPVYSISSIFRKEQVFFKWYGFQYRHVLRCFTHFFVQNEESKRLLGTLGIDNVMVTGDTRFDRVMQIAKESKSIPVVREFKNGKKVFVAGSSWLPDEQIFLSYFAQHLDWKVIIAPHVIGESHLEQIMSLLEGRKVVRYTQIEADDAVTLGEAEVLIIDCFGLLSSIYKYGDVAYVGGGFGVGIHNLPEAAVWNLPVIFGPNHQKFQEANELKACGGGIAIEGKEDFHRVMDAFLASEDDMKRAADAAGHYVSSHSGATEKLLKLLREKNGHV
ncbi:MAG: glycosyltransferase N-terminal domain-containing protein [Prevotellaceae bacterium]|nr:3-deoxy-D-manno-octulosonic acid transferase [Prevotella sp.]MDD7246845.1 glycosyltransferase N-terminal domain-containing protein [Prevotellaceae bacterium]MDY2749495.1 glycosyltransferase N-terminal domain-containing protein [Prevotella sp.]